MSWISAGGLYRHWQNRREIRRLSHEALVGPAFEHPILGLGGQSIELSVAVGRPVSADAVVVAVDTLHDLVDARRAGVPDAGSSVEAELDAADFLRRTAEGQQLPADTTATLAADVAWLAAL